VEEVKKKATEVGSRRWGWLSRKTRLAAAAERVNDAAAQERTAWQVRKDGACGSLGVSVAVLSKCWVAKWRDLVESEQAARVGAFGLLPPC
jgi:hypothetical protein